MSARTVARSRLVSLLVGLAMIVVAAVGYKLSEPPLEFQVVGAPVGELTDYMDGRAGVRSVAVATEVTRGTDRLSTPGLFVIVRMVVEAPGRDEVRVQNTNLVSQRTTYESFGLGSTVVADPGFETQRDLVFEVDPQRIDDLTVEAWDSSLVSGYHQRLRVHLGITSDNAAQWVAAAQGQRVALNLDETSRGLE